MTDWNTISTSRSSSGSSCDDQMTMGSPLPHSGNGPFSFLTSSFTQGIKEATFNATDFVSPSKEGEVSMEFSPFCNKKQMVDSVKIIRSRSTPTVERPCSTDESINKQDSLSLSPSKPLILENFTANVEPITRTQSVEVFAPSKVEKDSNSSIDQVLGKYKEKTSQLFTNISSRNKLFSCPETDDSGTLKPGDIFASSPGSPCSPDTPVLNLFNVDENKLQKSPNYFQDKNFENRTSDQRLRRCHSLEIRKNLFDLSNTPPNAFNRSTSRRSLFKRPLDIQVKEKNFSKRLRDGTHIECDDNKDISELKSLLSSPHQNENVPISEDKTPTRNEDRLSLDSDDKTPVSRNGKTSPQSNKQDPCLILKNRKMSEKDQERIKTAVDTLQSGELIADGSRVYCLPLVSGKHQDLKNINHQTMADLVNKKYCGAYDKLTVIDCRYPYEYQGGHIKGAINIYTEKEISDFLHLEIEKPSEKRGVHIIVFHCEFSSQRGPTMLRHLRSCDRQINMMDYPRLIFPEIYCLFGGYKEFYLNHPELCDPSAYTTMNDENQCAAYLHFKARAKTWSYDNRR